jgi:hypothetical protein
MLNLASCTKDLTNVEVVYQNDFNNGNLKGLGVAGWLASGQFDIIPYNKIFSYNNQTVLGRLNNSSVNMHFDTLPPHSVIRIEYDLYLHDTWTGGNLWVMQVDGEYRLITTFSNDSTIPQAYPNWFNSGPTSPAGNQAQEIYLPGLCSRKNQKRGTSYYRIVHSVPHSIKTLSISLSDAGNPLNDTCLRSWSIDNLKIVALKN